MAAPGRILWSLLLHQHTLVKGHGINANALFYWAERLAFDELQFTPHRKCSIAHHLGIPAEVSTSEAFAYTPDSDSSTGALSATQQETKIGLNAWTASGILGNTQPMTPGDLPAEIPATSPPEVMRHHKRAMAEPPSGEEVRRDETSNGGHPCRWFRVAILFLTLSLRL